jgi:hypothetical protein
VRRRAATAAPYTTAYTAFGVKCLVAPEVPNNAGSLAPITVSAPEGSQLSEAGRGIFSEAEAICLTCSGVWVRALFAYGTRSAVQRSTMPVGICIGGDPFFIARKNSRREIRKAAETLNFRTAGRELFLTG